MNKLLWILLQRVFCRGVDEESASESEGESGSESEVEEEVEEEVEAEEEVEEETESEATTPTKTESRAQKEIRTLRDRAQKAEDDAKAARAEIDAARRQQSQPAQPSEGQKLWEEEEKALKDPNIEPWQRYSIQSNRSARAAEFNSQRALAEAHDLKDQAEFERVAATNPKAAERYRKEVEEFKKANPAAPRKNILALKLGLDMLDGKLKPAATKPTKASGGADRGKLPGAKSDTRSSGSDKGDSIEALEKRLSGIRI